MTLLYWIHLPEHTDILSQGYIGVSKHPKRRLTEHKRNKENPHLSNSFEKYKNITYTILLQGPEDYCYEIEEKLRPHRKIGWNIDKGGGKPPSPKERMMGDGNPMKRPEIAAKRSGKYHPMKRPEIAAKKSYSQAKDYIIINPQGIVIQIHNLNKFAKENNLHQGQLWKVANGKIKHYKGWKCKYV